MPSATNVKRKLLSKDGNSEDWRRRLWVCWVLTKVILCFLWQRSFAKLNMGFVGNSPSVSQKVPHWIEKTKLNTI